MFAVKTDLSLGGRKNKHRFIYFSWVKVETVLGQVKKKNVKSENKVDELPSASYLVYKTYSLKES